MYRSNTNNPTANRVLTIVDSLNILVFIFIFISFVTARFIRDESLGQHIEHENPLSVGVVSLR